MILSVSVRRDIWESAEKIVVDNPRIRQNVMDIVACVQNEMDIQTADILGVLYSSAWCFNHMYGQMAPVDSCNLVDLCNKLLNAVGQNCKFEVKVPLSLPKLTGTILGVDVCDVTMDVVESGVIDFVKKANVKVG